MNILVTGAAGFIASHLIEELLQNQANQVFGIDNFYSGTKENLEYLKTVYKKGKFTFEEIDIRDFNQLNNIIKNNNINQVYHLAAIVSVQESIENPISSNNVNIKGTLNILEASRLNGVKKVVFSSSAAVYGDEPTLPKDELSPVKPISPYGVEKLVGEQYMNLYSNLYGLDTVSLRYFNVYGERQSATSDYSGVISIFDNRFKNNEEVNIYGDGEQYRDFVYVKDVVTANIKAMNSNNQGNHIFCVGTSNKTSINDLFEFMCRKYERSSKPVYKESRKGDILESICDNSKIKKQLLMSKWSKFEENIFKI